MKTVRRPRSLALSVAAVALALGASGCAYLNPVQTDDFYQAADGTNSSPEVAGVRNAVLVVDGNGDGRFMATAVNPTEEDTTVELVGSYEDTTVFSTTVDVAAEETVTIGGEGDQTVTATGVQAPAGAIMQLTVRAPGQEDQTISLPVQDESLPYYGGSDSGQ